MDSIAVLLRHSERNWKGFNPANKNEVEELISSVNVELPAEFLDLLRFSNGGEGDIALPPLIFHLNSIQEIIDLEKDDFYKNEFPHFLFFGGNNGLEMIAFDLRTKPYPIVMIDPIGGEATAVEIAQNIVEFINAIGFEYKNNA